MAQELHVLRCYSCNIFQVQIVKKVKKWQCKICNEKQSLQKVYFQGSGQECRLQVQHMNLTQHYKDEKEFETLKTQVRIIEENHEEEEEEEKDYEKPLITRSKWTKYIVEEIVNEKEDLDTIRNIDENQFSDSEPSIENNILLEFERENLESERSNGQKRKFEDDKELDLDYFRSKRTKFNKESFQLKKNLRDIIKTNRKKSGKLFDQCKLAKEDSETNKYSVNKETISSKSSIKKKNVFQSDFDDFDDNFDL